MCDQEPRGVDQRFALERDLGQRCADGAPLLSDAASQPMTGCEVNLEHSPKFPNLRVQGKAFRRRNPDVRAARVRVYGGDREDVLASRVPRDPFVDIGKSIQVIRKQVDGALYLATGHIDPRGTGLLGGFHHAHRDVLGAGTVAELSDEGDSLCRPSRGNHGVAAHAEVEELCTCGQHPRKPIGWKDLEVVRSFHDVDRFAEVRFHRRNATQMVALAASRGRAQRAGTASTPPQLVSFM